MEEILAGVITALVTVIALLVGLIKFYLPRQHKGNNPGSGGQELLQGLERVVQSVEGVRAEMAKHNETAQERHLALMLLLTTIKEQRQ